MNNVREEMRGWLDEVLTDIQEAGSVSIISLMHMDGYGREIDIYNMKSGSPKWGDAAGMSETLFRMADRHSRGLPGAQQFRLQAMYGPENRPLRYMPFGMTGALHFGALPGGGLASEPATATGQLQQGMRLTEMHVQGTYAERQQLSHMSLSLIEGLRAENLAIKKEWAELWIACKDLLLELNKQRHDTRMSELSAMRAAEFQKYLMALAPALINMMAGKDIFPAMMAEESILDGLAAGTTPEQLQMLTGIVTTQVKNGEYLAGVITDRFNKYHERQERMRAEERRLMKSTPGASYEEGERDAVGEATKALRGRREESWQMKQLPTEAVKIVATPVAATEKAGDSKESANGHVATVVVEKPADTVLIERLFSKVPEGMIGALSATLAAEDPELAAAIQKRYAESKKA